MKKIISVSTLALFLGALMFVSSCSKHDDVHYGPSSSESQQEKNIRKIKELIKRLPDMKVANQGLHRNGKPTSILDDGFSFSDPNSGGMHFSSPDGITYTTNPNGGVGFTVSASSFGSNSSSGTVVAGSSSLDINFTFCFNSSGNAVGLNLFDLGPTFSGVSAVIGVSGDFKAMSTADSTTSFADLFHGFAFYIVYAGTAEGSYPVIDWFGGDLNDNSYVDNKCFAFVIDFQTGHLYLSSSGTVDVTGGSMNFNGEYLDVGGIDLSTFDLNGGGLTYSTVSGFGTMGCN